MLTRPGDLDEAHLAELLAQRFGLEVTELTYLPVGFGSHHWRAVTATTEWFVTIDDLAARAREPGDTAAQTRAWLLAALTTAAELRDHGHDFVVAPRPAEDGQVAVDLDGRYLVALYPMLAGETHAFGPYADPDHLAAVVDRLAALHAGPPSCRQWAMTETFAIARRAALAAARSALADRWDGGPFAEPTRRLLARHVDEVARAFARYDAFVVTARTQSDRFVLTHGEPHPGNTITTAGGVVLVDWDTTLIAPPERDLWRLVLQDPSVAERYHSLTGVRVEHDAVELYRLAWDLADVAIYVSDLRRPHERTDDTAQAWDNLERVLDAARW